jgi:hypothetical protein
MKASLRSRVFLELLLLAAAPIALAACGRSVTAAELGQWDTRTYKGATAPQLQHATSVALRTMGFTIVDESGGRIKTAPKVVVVSAAGSRYSAVAVDNSLAWAIEISPAREGATIHASIRPSQGGVSLQPTAVNVNYVEAWYRDLYREIENNLNGASGTAPTATTTPTSASVVGSKKDGLANDGSTTFAKSGPEATPTAPAPSGAMPAASPAPEGALPAVAEGPRSAGASIAGLLGYGFNDAANIGVGLRGGYTWPMRLYVGGMFMYHLGSSQSTAVGTFSESSHVNIFYGGVEGGYDFDAGPLILRPYGGLGPVWVSASVQNNAPLTAAGAVNVSRTDSRVGFWFGATALYPVSSQVALGGDARILVVSDYNTFNLLLAGAYRF